MSGFGVYYYHFTKQQDIKSDQVLLSPDLAPVIDIQNVKRTYLGYPYTDCVKTFATNNYSYLFNSNPQKIYSGILFIYSVVFTFDLIDSTCIMNELMDIICKLCGCFPSYLASVHDIKSNCSQ